ncbi:MAG: hypothetical protein ACI9V8_001287 [Urechidicola sp.]|jgi:hypothetical protein
MKKLLLTIFLVLHCASALAFSYTLKLSEADIQERVDGMMPLEKKKFFVTTILTNPLIDLVETTNELGLSTDVGVKVPGNIVGNGEVSFSGTLRYDNDSGSLYFDNLKVVSLDVKKVPPDSLPKIKKLLEFIAKKFLAKNPVFTFRDDNLKHRLAESTLKSISVENEMLIIELGLF